MSVGSRRAEHWRARSRTCIALVVLTAWFGTLLAAAPLTTAANAATTSPGVASPTGLATSPAPSGAVGPTITFALPINTSTDTYTAQCAVVPTGALPPDPAGSAWSTCASGDTLVTWPADSTTYDLLVETVDVNTAYTIPADTSSATISTTLYSDPARVAYTRSAPPPTPPTAPAVSFDIPVPTTAGPITPFPFTVAGYDATTDATSCGYAPAGTPPATVALTSCKSPFVPFASASTGSYVVVVQVTRTTSTGSASALDSATVALDATAPVVAIGIVDATTPNQPSWPVTSDDLGAVPQCTLTGTVTATNAGYSSGPAACAASTSSTTSPYAYTYVAPVLLQGSYTLTVTATDPAGNVATPATQAYVFDTTGPAAPLLGSGDNGNPGYAKTSPITWSVTPGGTPSDTARITCTVTYDGTTPPTVASTTTSCGSSVQVSPAADQQGVWTLTATAYDAVGNPSATVTSSTTYDSIIAAPVVVRNGGTPTAPTWSVTVASDVRAICSVAGVLAATDCTGQTVTMDLANKPGAVYTLVVTSRDLAGNVAAPVSVDYARPPDAPTVSVAAAGRSTNPAWTIASQSGVTLACRLIAPDGTPVTPDAPCASGMTPTLGPANGLWNLEVIASYDNGGTPVNSAAGTTANGYFLDTTPPGLPSVASTPTGSTNNGAIRWDVTMPAGDTPVRGAVRVDCDVYFTPVNGTRGFDHTITSCEASTWTLGLSTTAQQGVWQIEARAVDAVGNSSAAVPGPVITYDISAPNAPVIHPVKSPWNNPSPTWTIDTEPGSTLECSWTTGNAVPTSWFTCYPVGVLTVPTGVDGVYTLHARATDSALNLGPEATPVAYELDRTKPLAPSFSTPTSPNSNPVVSWVVTPQPRATGQAEANYFAECLLLVDDGTGKGTFTAAPGATWIPCPASYTLPSENTYELQARITDEAGNVGVVGTSAPYLFDKTAPAAPKVTGPTGPSKIRDVTWTITPTDLADTLECRFVENGIAVGSFTTCQSKTSVTRTALPDGSYALQVREIDAANNISTPVSLSPTYVVDNLGPVAPSFAGLAGTGNTKSTSWSFSVANEPNSKAYCLLLLNGVAKTGDQPALCMSGDTFSLLRGDGSYQLEVYFTDEAGNVGAAAKSSVYLLDTVKPGVPTNIVGTATGTANTTTATYTYTVEPGTVYCRLLFTPAGALAAPGPIAPGTYSDCTQQPWGVSFAAGDGNYQVEVYVRDAAGNDGPSGLSAVYTLDTTGPLAPTFLTQPTGTKNVKAVTWTWSGETPSTGTCSLSFTPIGGTTSVGTPVACNTFTYSTTLTADGTYQLSVQLTDPWNNVGATKGSELYVLDATAPLAPTVSGPTGTSNKTAADYAITSGVEAGAKTECLLFRDKAPLALDFTACTMPRTIDLAGDGSYVLQVRLTDQYGNVGAPGESPAYLLDTKAPTVPVVTAPASPSSNPAPTFSIGTDADTKTTCKLSRGSVVAADTVACAGSFTASLSGMPDGDYVLSVVATDPAGNTTTGVSAPYTYDTTKPLAPVVTGPAGPSQTRTPVFSWSGEAGTSAECSLQEKAGSAGAWTPCSTPYAPSLPSDGTWVLSVRLTDTAKNVSDPGASGAYVFDTTPPATPVVTPPTSPGRDLNPSWSAATEEGSKTECRITGPGQLGAWAPCTLPVTTPVSSDGTYTFEVRATDVAGNLSQVGSGSYVLDTMAPAAPVVTPPASPGRSRNPAISFTAEAGTTGSCKLTHGTTVLSDSAACSSPVTLDLTGLPDGAYTLSVRAVDAAGNVGPAGTATYVLDTTAPAAPTMTLTAGSPSSARSPSYAFNTESGTTASCKVTVPGGVVKDLPCTNTVSLDLTNAVDGDYVLTIRSTDAAGNIGAPATVTYVLDSNAPAAPSVVGPVTPGNNRAPVWKISSASPAECRLTRGTTVLKDWTPCSTSYAADLYAQPDGAYLLEARVVGTTAATASRYRLDTTAPAAATIVGPPSPSTDRKPTWAVSSTDATATAQCRVLVFTGVLKDWAPCGVSTAGSLFSYDLTTAGDGTYTLAVRLTDAAGNLGPVATSDYVLDTSAPSAVGVVAPASPGSDTTPTWTLTSATGVKLECRVSSGQKVITDFAPCAGTFTADLTGLPDGTYTLTVHALSAAGTPGPETTSGYILDTTAASTPGALTGPTGPSRDRAPRWTFTLPAGTTGLCKVTFGIKVVSEGPCTSPYTLDLSNAADGTYTLTVRAIDAAGNISSPSTAGYILKTTAPPAPTYTTLPGSPSSTTDPRWGFSLTRGTTAQCRLLQGGTALEDWTACTSPVTAFLSGKPDGVYTMQVRAVDLAGNTSGPAAGGGEYIFDRTAAPIAQFADTPATPGNDTSPTWVIAQPVPIATTTAPALLRTAALTGTPQTECRLTTAARLVGGWAPCSGSYTATTNGDGSYLLEVRAYDATGERGPVTSSAYLLDTRAPAAPRFIDPIPPTAGNDSEVAWSWADDGNMVECHVLRNGAPLSQFAECSAPHVFSIGRLGEATYSIEARAVDAAGNVGSVATATYRYDITPPPAPVFTAQPPSRGTSSSVGWTYAVPVDTHAVCVVTRNGTVVSEGSCTNAFTLDLRGQQPATWTLSVHFVDSAGNVGAATAGSYTLTTALASVGRVASPGGPGNTDNGGLVPSRPGGGGTSRPAGPPTTGPVDKPILAGPGADPRPGSSLSRVVPDVIKKGASKIAQVAARIPGALPGTNVPAAIKNVLGQTITKPQLPLALFVIVLLFLLVQNRIDRRDPKLAAAPVNAEPELTFGPILRPGGATA